MHGSVQHLECLVSRGLASTNLKCQRAICICLLYDLCGTTVFHQFDAAALAQQAIALCWSEVLRVKEPSEYLQA